MMKPRLTLVASLSLAMFTLSSCKSDKGRSNNGNRAAGQAANANPETPAPGTTPSTPAVPVPGLFTLTDQSRSLSAILEQGQLSKADCDRYFKGEKDRETTLRCGKWMFFYDSIGVPGSPAKLADLIRDHAPKTVGKSFERLGLYPDPYSKSSLPVGMAPGPDMVAGVGTYTITCGGCHFGQIPDGRYVVGQPNPKFEFGKMILAITTLPELAIQSSKKLPPAAEKILDPIKEEVFGKTWNRLEVIGQVIALLPNVLVKKNKPLTDESKEYLAILPPGVMDPYSPPSLDDKVRVPVRMTPLWGIDPKAMEAAGSKHGAMLGSSGGSPDLQHILRTFSMISSQLKGEPVPKDFMEKVAPLIEYITSLAPPKKEGSFDKKKLAVGEKLFQKSCISCHNGPGFAGTQVFDPMVIGTDTNVMRMVDADKTGRAVFDVVLPEELTNGVRARKLSGIFSLSHLLHNGSVSSLAELFCLNGPRPESSLGSGFSSAGHRFTCDGLSTPEKADLIYYLESL